MALEVRTRLNANQAFKRILARLRLMANIVVEDIVENLENGVRY